MSHLESIPLVIGGRQVGHAGRRAFDAVDPARGVVCGSVVEAGEADVDEAVKAARAALAGPWGRSTESERVAALRRIAAGIRARATEFIDAEITDTGKPVSLAGTFDIPRGAANFDVFADLLAGSHGEAWHDERPDGTRALHYTRRSPLGVVAVICPWNLPFLLMTWKVAPALACGNAVVVKPSEETPRTATLLAEVMHEAGIPDGVYNVVHGFGPGSAGEALTRHPGVDAITFTGESRTGEAIMAAAARGLRPISFELGGKNPALILADADVEAAIEGTARSAFMNSGQICLCTERVYVHRSLFTRVVEGLADRARRVVAGDPRLAATNLGPLISAAHRDKVLGYLDLARREGARVEAGGGTLEVGGPWAGGFWVEPTVWTGLAPSSRTEREEVFGPVCSVTPFDDDEEAIALANGTDYGLCAAVWTRDISRAHRLAGRIDAGLVWVNTWYLRDLRTPFGGTGRSGIGREGGRHSFDFYSETKTICIRTA
jgi:aminomuconate-semialdehyde/2-hydroxymuconate-6-semialdehyde dehydrogenase